MFEVVRRNYESKGIVTITVEADSYEVHPDGSVTFFKTPFCLPKHYVVSYARDIWLRISPIEPITLKEINNVNEGRKEE